MSPLSIIIMVVGLIGLVFCAKKQKTNPAMQPVAFLCLIVVLIGLGISVHKEMTGTSSDQESELNFMYSKSARVGKLAAQLAPGKKVLYINTPGGGDQTIAEAQLNAFKEAYGSENVIVDSIQVPANFAEGGMILEEIMTNKEFDALIAKHSDAEIIVSDIGLPARGRSLKIFTGPADKRPLVFLLNQGAMAGNDLVRLLKEGKIASMIIFNAKADFDVPASSDELLKAFDVRYFLVTKDNVDQYKSQM